MAESQEQLSRTAYSKRNKLSIENSIEADKYKNHRFRPTPASIAGSSRPHEALFIVAQFFLNDFQIAFAWLRANFYINEIKYVYKT